MDWKVLLEVARGRNDPEIGADDVRRLVSVIGHARAAVLHHPERYALQLSVEAPTPADALRSAVLLWEGAVGDLQLPWSQVVRAEVLTVDEYARECQLYEERGEPEPPSLTAAVEGAGPGTADGVVSWQAVPALLPDVAVDSDAAAAPDAPVRVAVCDEASSYRRGLGPVLAAAGYLVEELDDVRVRAVVYVDVLLFTVRSASDWQVLRDLVSVNRHLKLIALLVDATPDRHAEALRCGAHSAVPWGSPPEAIVAVVAGAVHGVTVFPTPVARAIAVGGAVAYDPEWITPEEVEWLRMLAGGATVQQLAEKVGSSERALYRVLHGLYGRMRVSNRSEAILQAQRWGLLED